MKLLKSQRWSKNNTWAKRSYRVWANSPHVGESVCMSHRASPCPVIPAPDLGMSCHRTRITGSNDSCSVSDGAVQTALMAPGAMTDEGQGRSQIVIKARLVLADRPKLLFTLPHRLEMQDPPTIRELNDMKSSKTKMKAKKKKKCKFLTGRFRPVSCVSFLRQLFKKPQCLNESESHKASDSKVPTCHHFHPQISVFSKRGLHRHEH